MTQIQLELVTPQRTIVNESVDKIILPGIEGEMCILPEHVPLLTIMDSGILSYTSNDHTSSFAVHEGYVQIDSGSVRVLVELAEKPEDIDIDRAKEAEKNAKKKLSAPSNINDPNDAKNNQIKYESKLKRSLIRQRLTKMV